MPQNSDIVLRVRVARRDDKRVNPPPYAIQVNLSAQLIYENFKPVEGGNAGGRIFRLVRDSDPLCTQSTGVAVLLVAA